jgi:hypothetical protein
VIARALAKVPENRYATPTALMLALRQASRDGSGAIDSAQPAGVAGTFLYSIQ